jgi:hypothetical protein
MNHFYNSHVFVFVFDMGHAVRDWGLVLSPLHVLSPLSTQSVKITRESLDFDTIGDLEEYWSGVFIEQLFIWLFL